MHLILPTKTIDLETMEEELQILLRDLEDSLKLLQRNGDKWMHQTSEKDKQKRWQRIVRSIKQCQDKITEIELFIVQLEGSDKKKATRRIQQLKQDFITLQSRLENAHSNTGSTVTIEMHSIHPGATEYIRVEPSSSSTVGPMQPVIFKANEVREVKQVLDVQEETKNTLQNIYEGNIKTIDVGTSTADTLKKQTEKMMEIQKRLDELGSGTKRARIELARFLRQMACNAVVIIICILVVIAAVICVVIFTVLKILRPDLIIFRPNTYQPTT